MDKLYNMLSVLPRIRRAREYRLYDCAGRRFLDMFQNSGNALLGHRPEGLSVKLKNTISRGLVSGVPSAEHQRLAAALKKSFPAYAQIRIYENSGHALSDLQKIFPGLLDFSEIQDPLLGQADCNAPGFWRPLVESIPQYRVLVPVIPFPGLWNGTVLCFHNSDAPERELPPISPVLAEGLHHCLVKALNIDLDVYTAAAEAAWSSGVWKVSTPYLIPDCTQAEYSKLFTYLLEKQILISPYYNTPSILPACYSRGEIAPLKNLLQKALGDADD